MDKNSYYETVKNTAIEKVLNKYSSDSDSSRPALKKLLEDLLDWFMLSECQIYLLNNENDKGNGFYDRKLATPMGNLDISVSRTRTGDFRPYILPEPYKMEPNRSQSCKVLFLSRSYSLARDHQTFLKAAKRAIT